MREKYNIKRTDFLSITGGKIDSAKRQTLLLMQAVQQIEKRNVKLIVFGSVINDLKEEVQSFSDGWIQSDDCYKFFATADLVFFSGRHSFLWEQAVGTGVPCLFKCWEGTTHVGIGGNCAFLYKDSVEEIKYKVEALINEQLLYKNMKLVAENKGLQKFSYLEIAKSSLQSQE